MSELSGYEVVETLDEKGNWVRRWEAPDTLEDAASILKRMEAEEKGEEKSHTIFRTEKSKDNPFVMVDRRVFDNPNLSWKAKGILGYLLSKPDGWVTRQSDIVKHSKDGKTAVASAIQELIDAGYIHREQNREKGRFDSVSYTVFEEPHY